MSYFTYILYSGNRDKYYIGVTQDIAERLKKHNTNHSGYTGKTGDWALVYYESYETKIASLKRECEIKSWKSRNFYYINY
ncbi:MAG: excinuclease ABC subunit C [Bacteroidetes bacterium RIFOXYA12_FULL_35_11]|nr:MAG: excinuclease ABC subunit C [Bacteroidetes bacterium GWF2_35_48]OFY74732.1 MAG: excinuclease ABC subunit C [Bacteroidetes bacterium RIFOXYA12_FULL_35_11]OFY93336.1 MAG: excinuclease ABC subunit C [Bacteroidetes bacterium RIFOXYB2_FULL_35_7]HBX52492.1 excinuclease ABC subunit C [Bacteroidales bacterium]